MTFVSYNIKAMTLNASVEDQNDQRPNVLVCPAAESWYRTCQKPVRVNGNSPVDQRERSQWRQGG